MQCVLESLKPHTQWEHIYNEYLEVYKLNEENFVIDAPAPQSSSTLTYPLPSSPCTRTRGAAAAAAAIEKLLTAEPSSPPPPPTPPVRPGSDRKSVEPDGCDTESSSSSQPASSSTPEPTIVDLETDKN